MYEIDYEHVINRKIDGINVTLYFSKQKNEKVKDIVLGILMDNYEKRMQDYMEKNTKEKRGYANSLKCVIVYAWHLDNKIKM